MFLKNKNKNNLTNIYYFPKLHWCYEIVLEEKLESSISENRALGFKLIIYIYIEE